MIEFAGRTILLDIEGTTSSIRFVYDEMFPFVRRELRGFLTARGDDQDVTQACELIARDAGQPSLADWLATAGGPSAQELVHDEVLRLMDADVKATGLKQLQGLIWKSGFESGELRAHVYDDVPPALQRWQAAGIDLRIYSSGSVAAQRLFFGHTEAGNLLPLLHAHYDTTTGPKREPASYHAITDDIGCQPADVLFLSDVVAELEAARTAGLRTGLCIRPGNAEPPADHDYASLHSFDEVHVAARSD